MLKLFTVILLVVTFYACSGLEDAEVMNADVYQGYRFEYDEATNETYIGAVFKLNSEDGEVIKLASPALLKVNDQVCGYNAEDVDFPYSLSFTSRLPEAVLDFIDYKKQEFVNKMELDSIVQVKDFVTVIDSASHQIKVSFVGDDRCPGEMLKLIVSAKGKELSYDIAGTDSNTIVVNEDILKDFKGELVSMKLCRIKNIDLLNVSPAGGSVQFVYASKIKEVQL